MKRILTVLTAILTVAACSGSSDTGSGFGVMNPVLFASRRLLPGNTTGDGDIFSVVPTQAGVLTNLTNGTAETGDDTDYACALDLSTGRNRLIFVSERTDVGNVAGDVDVFSVPVLGGTITNLTDADSGDRDDACLGIVPNTGSVVFESTRTVAGESATPTNGDLDIYVVAVEINSSAVAFQLTVSNRTNETSGTDATDKLVYIGASSLYFESNRTGADDSAVPIVNADADQHIFSASTFGTPKIINLTDDGDVASADTTNPISNDVFCGLDPSERFLAFQSTRDQGAAVSGVQLSEAAGARPDQQDVFVRDRTVASAVTGSVNAAVGNLTDAGQASMPHSGVNPEDDQDICTFGRGINAVVDVDGEPRVLFVSNRTASGSHFPASSGGFTTFDEFSNPPTQLDSGDLFSSTLSVVATVGALNEVVNLSDSTVTTPGDDTDTYLGTCGTNAIFASARTDLAPSSTGNEDDLYSVDLMTTAITNRTDGAAGDDNDVFVCCNVHSDRLVFASQRTDIDNAAGDMDLFEAALGDDAEALSNLTGTDDGDGNDAFTTINTTFKVITGGTGSVAATGRYGTTSGFDYGLSFVPSIAYDLPATPPGAHYTAPVYAGFGIACNSSDQIIFASDRTAPANSSADIDLFIMPFVNSLNQPAQPADILNLTDASTFDGPDGITAVGNTAIPTL